MNHNQNDSSSVGDSYRRKKSQNGGSGRRLTEGEQKITKAPMGLGVYEGRAVVDKPGAEPNPVGKKGGQDRLSDCLGSEGRRNLNCTT